MTIAKEIRHEKNESIHLRQIESSIQKPKYRFIRYV